MGLLTAKPSSARIDEKDPWFLDIDERPDWATLFRNRQPLKFSLNGNRVESNHAERSLYR